MPNWCYGILSISNIREDEFKEVESFFLKYGGDNPITKYFARTFLTDSDWYDNEGEIVFDCAWSVYSCMIDGYPQEDPKNLLTLEELLEIFPNIEIKIESKEPCIGFIEYITGDRYGITYESEEAIEIINLNGNPKMYPKHPEIYDYIEYDKEEYEYRWISEDKYFEYLDIMER